MSFRGEIQRRILFHVAASYAVVASPTVAFGRSGAVKERLYEC